VELAVQMSRRVTGRPLQLTLDHAYLAAYGTCGQQTDSDWVRVPWDAGGAGVDPGELPWERIGTFVFEPGNSGGRVLLPPRALVAELAERTRAAGGLVVADEVTTGLGRTGAWLGCEHYDLAPDLLALGKGLGNGYPVSAVTMTAAVGQALRAADFHHAQSHQNDPIAAAVAATVIQVIREEGLLERSREVGAWFRERLAELVARHPLLGEVRGRGLMVVAEFARGVDRATQDAVFAGLVARGYLCGYKPAYDLLRFYPPLVIGREQLEGLIGALDAVLSAGEVP
jgi:acetylornithine aminotransferase